ncbi:hypothetical protein TREMEDRAFT_65215 [Tremella mesenterica DSM 1558]|uniref:uncharacterized protein n=1 Tax=Tremella mesenterica (strain ATCC 24925 / CBS 8224 / DSM 1558 / NBRC 9311 / NRRL Y-6157 / RJB 2259-6 / UBC 559-6) TaxID=578456 RepID=UPI00032C9736|nr:uncharacterized protein TREMEDRAFT_65215 [Tremella mesenterica DSM 1558]EIW66810.1 hypothetical protein TREMEDRAFT_65215 [Tremella mesenterica DSM 1558]
MSTWQNDEKIAPKGSAIDTSLRLRTTERYYWTILYSFKKFKTTEEAVTALNTIRYEQQQLAKTVGERTAEDDPTRRIDISQYFQQDTGISYPPSHITGDAGTLTVWVRGCATDLERQRYEYITEMQYPLANHILWEQETLDLVMKCTKALSMVWEDVDPIRSSQLSWALSQLYKSRLQNADSRTTVDIYEKSVTEVQEAMKRLQGSLQESKTNVH